MNEFTKNFLDRDSESRMYGSFFEVRINESMLNAIPQWSFLVKSLYGLGMRGFVLKKNFLCQTVLLHCVLAKLISIMFYMRTFMS